MLPLVLPSSAMNMEVVMEEAIRVALPVALPVAFQAAFQAFQGMEGVSLVGLKNQVNLLSLKSQVGPPGLMTPQNQLIL